MSKEKTMSIFAQTLIAKADFAGKYAKLDKSTLGDDFSVWKSTIVACLADAYAVYAQRHDNGMNDSVSVDMGALYAKVNAVRDMVGEVNGMKLNSAIIAELMVGASHTARRACYSNDAASADCELESARAKKRTIEKRPVSDVFTDEVKAKAIAKAQADIDSAKERVDALMQVSGNYRDVPTAVSDSAFLSKVEVELRTIVNQQCAKSWEQIQAEKKALNDARKARRNAK